MKQQIRVCMIPFSRVRTPAEYTSCLSLLRHQLCRGIHVFTERVRVRNICEKHAQTQDERQLQPAGLAHRYDHRNSPFCHQSQKTVPNADDSGGAPAMPSLLLPLPDVIVLSSGHRLLFHTTRRNQPRC